MGLSFFFAWFFALYTNPVLIPHGVGSQPGSILRLSLIAGVVISLLVTWRLSGALASPRGANVLLVSAIVTSSVWALPVLSGGLSPVVQISTWALTGIGYAALLLLWGVFLCTLGHRQALLYPALAVGLGTLLCMSMAALKDTAVIAAAVMLPLLSAGLFVMTQGGFPLVADPHGALESGRRASFADLWRSIVAIVAHSTCLGFALYYLTMESGRGYALFLAGLAIVAASVLMVTDAARSQRIDEGLQLKMLAPMAALGLLPVAFVGQAGWLVCCLFLLAGFMTQYILAWSAVSEHTRVYQLAPIAAFSYGRLGNVAGVGIGYLLGILTFHGAAPGQLTTPAVPSAIVLVLVFAQAYVLREHYPYRLEALEPSAGEQKPAAMRGGGEGGSWHRRCEQFSDYHHLSPRQKEVLVMLAKGRNAEYVQEKLFISGHTAKAHIYNIYRKTDVHSHRELIDCIEQFAQDEDEQARGN